MVRGVDWPTPAPKVMAALIFSLLAGWGSGRSVELSGPAQPCMTEHG